MVDDYTSELIPDNDLGVLWGSPITSFPGDTQPVEASHNTPPGMRKWGSEYKEWFASSYRRIFSMHTQTSSLPYAGGYCDLDPNVRDPFGQPALRMTHDWMPHDINSMKFFTRVKEAIAKDGKQPAFFSNLGVALERVNRLEEAVAALERLHPYDTPAVLVIPTSGGSDNYRRWIKAMTEPTAEPPAAMEPGSESGPDGP